VGGVEKIKRWEKLEERRGRTTKIQGTDLIGTKSQSLTIHPGSVAGRSKKKAGETRKKKKREKKGRPRWNENHFCEMRPMTKDTPEALLESEKKGVRKGG